MLGMTNSTQTTHTFDTSTAAITRIANAQAELLDHTGHVWQHLSDTQARRLVAEINRLRQSVGWARIDMTGRRRFAHVVTDA